MLGKYRSLSRMMHDHGVLLCLVCLSWALPYEVFAGDCQSPVAEIVSVQGVVESQVPGSRAWEPVHQHDTFCSGELIRVRSNSRAGLYLANDTFLRLGEQTSIRFSELTEKTSTWLELISGIAHFMSRVKHSFEIHTAYVNAAIDGTEFTVRVDETNAEVIVMEGQVVARNTMGSVRLSGGQSASAMPGQAPVLQLVVHPRDAVQWALYYPPVVFFDRDEIKQTLSQSLQAYLRGDMAQAFAGLTEIDQQAQDSGFFNYRATLNLSVGRIASALADIDQALVLQEDHPDALALKSIVATVRNDTDAALLLAEQAIVADQHAAGPRIAQSYALQARFELEPARKTVMTATEFEPENALAWSRLAELQLMLGNLDAASQASQRAVELEPDIALTQTADGYANLIRLDIEAAKQSFERAIALEQAAPLPRLGLGLALIRGGELSVGRSMIETAANLDPGNALIRSYLGKAYYEQTRNGEAAAQFELAKTLDPLDPTSWFYDAILKQSENRPIEALTDLQSSIKLNDNRAVYRSRFLLDQDLAARSSSLARIYSDLGFQQLARVDGWKSTISDPSSHSAHRFLSDSFASLPRHEIARVSELLQAQLLQPVNINPIQPQLAESNLQILEGSGPSNLAFNEFNPLFARDRITLQTSGIVGSNDTKGDDLVLSGMKGNLSYSLGQFHYESDGFRENNDVEHDIYDAFVQLAFSPNNHIQFELRSRDTETGDLNLRFYPEYFFPGDRRNIETDQFRLGYHYSPAPGSHFLISAIYEQGTDSTLLDFSDEIDIFQIESSVDAESYTTEVQYMLRTQALNLIAGAGIFREDGDGMDTEISEFRSFDEPRNVEAFPFDQDTDHDNAYVYINVPTSFGIDWTLGLSYDNFSDENTDQEQLNPKLGMIWNPRPSTSVRLAAFGTLKRALASNQTVEPTHVAGFNQFFDDPNGSSAKRYGAGVDQRFTRDVYGGIEFSWRELEVPTSLQTENRDEQSHRGYVYWTPNSSLSLSAEYHFEDFKRDVPRGAVPNALETRQMPLHLTYFSPKQYFVMFGATYVQQNVEFAESTGGAEFIFVKDNDEFWVADIEASYRLPKRFGVISVLVKNVFDNEFNFQDQNFQTTETLNPVFTPERTAYLKFKLAF